MKIIELKGNLRENLGKKGSKLLRKEDKVPCVLYGGENVVHFHVTERSLKNVIYTPNVYIINLDLDGNKYNAVLQDMQFHPVNDRPLHLDFLEIKDNQTIKVSIPVQLNGFAAGVKQGGKLSLNLKKIRVKGLAKDLPDVLEINVEKLTLGKTIKVGDLSFDNLELLDAKNAVVAAVKLTRAARGAMLAGEGGAEEGAEEGTEGTAAEAASEE